MPSRAGLLLQPIPWHSFIRNPYHRPLYAQRLPNKLYVLERQSSSQTQGLSPSTSIRSPEDSTLLLKTPLDIRLIPNQLQHSQIVNWQSYKAKKFDKQDIPFPPASLGDFSESRTPQTSFTSAAFASKSGSISNFSGSSPKSLFSRGSQSNIGIR